MDYIFTHRFVFSVTCVLLAAFAVLIAQIAVGNSDLVSLIYPQGLAQGAVQEKLADKAEPGREILSEESQDPKKGAVTQSSGKQPPTKALSPIPPMSDSDKEFLRLEKEWLIKCQLPQGAIAQTPGGDHVVPYFANLSAKTLVELDQKRAKRYFTWYLNNLESPDKWGLEGTIYDYRVVDGILEPTYNYDSADSYASTFLTAISYYYEKTKDKDFIISNLESINKVAKVITGLQDKDGLVFVKPKNGTKYLMDNAENYRGLKDFASCLNALNYKDMASVYESAASKIASGIKTVLYNPYKGYAWSYSKFAKHFPVKGRWYPDGVSQIYLISNSVVDSNDAEAQSIWDSFNAQFPGWEEGVKNDKFPWGTVALASRMMKDTGRAQRFLSWAKRQFADQGRPYPWYVLESSSLIELETRLAQEGLEDASAPSLAGR